MSTEAKQWTIRSSSDLGRAISGLRRDAGLTQEDLSEDLCVGRTYLARLESGHSTLAIERALRTIRRLGGEVTVRLPNQSTPKEIAERSIECSPRTMSILGHSRSGKRTSEESDRTD